MNELTGGEWVQDGLIRRWTGPRPADEPIVTRSETCEDCRRELIVRSQWRRMGPDERLPTQACRSTLTLCTSCLSRRGYRARNGINLQIGA
jgi:hypothetical protein